MDKDLKRFSFCTDFIVSGDSNILEFMRDIAFNSGRFGVNVDDFFLRTNKELSETFSEEND